MKKKKKKIVKKKHPIVDGYAVSLRENGVHAGGAWIMKTLPFRTEAARFSWAPSMKFCTGENQDRLSA